MVLMENTKFLEEEIPLVPSDPQHDCQIAKNAKELNRRIVLVKRGDYSFFAKATVAEEAGVKALIIVDYRSSSFTKSVTNSIWIDYYCVEIIRDDTILSSKAVNISAGFLLGKNG